MKIKYITVELEFTEFILGTAPADKDLYKTYIATAVEGKKLAEEVESLGIDGVVEKGMTIFHKDKFGRPFLFDYQIKGFFKDAAKSLRRIKLEGEKKPNLSSGIAAYIAKIDTLIFPTPRQIEFYDYGEINVASRTLRANTPQGEITAISVSEQLEAGCKIKFDIEYLSDELHDPIIEWLNYGRLRGIGQWRNSGAGRFKYKVLEEGER